jgi:hypothetical protein
MMNLNIRGVRNISTTLTPPIPPVPRSVRRVLHRRLPRQFLLVFLTRFVELTLERLNVAVLSDAVGEVFKLGGCFVLAGSKTPLRMRLGFAVPAEVYSIFYEVKYTFVRRHQHLLYRGMGKI